MLKNNLKIAWRSLLKNKSASLINISGLTIGLTCCLLMVMYMQHELSYDKFHSNGDRLARVIMQYAFNNSELTSGNFTSTKVLPSFKKNFPEVIDGVRLNDQGRLVKYKDITFDEAGFLFADSSFFKLFDFKLIKGDPDLVLNAPNQIVLSQTAAKKYFPKDEDPIGKVLQVSTTQDNYTVTGIVEDCPSNSQIQFDMVASFISLGKPQEESYFEANFTTYLLLNDINAITTLENKIEPFMKNELKGEEGVYINYILEPYTKVHLHSAYDAMTANSNIKYIYIIGAIALLVLIIACFTYINLSTARSMERAKEVGIRKVSGAIKGQLFRQFITESFLISFISFVFSLAVLILVLPAFNQLTDRHLGIRDCINPFILGTAVLIITFISLLAGSYPALVLSNFEPIKVLKGAFKNTSSGIWMRQSIIVFQFVISLFLIASTIVIGTQLRYIQNKNLGYNRQHVLILKTDRIIRDKMELIKTDLKSNANVLQISTANFSPVHIPGGYVMYRGDQSADKAINTRGNNIDEDYIKVNNLEIIAGEDLNHQDIIDATQEDYTKNYFHFIINETGANKLGWKPNEAIGKKMFLGEGRPGEIKAVVKDFHFASLHNAIEPVILFPSIWNSTLMIKLSGNSMQETLSFIQERWKKLIQHRPLEYRFMDEDFNKLYTSEMKTAKIFNLFSSIAILLACLGLFGLSSYAAHQRMKEMGIRKVLGASIGNLFLLLSSSFIKMVLLACIIAIPIAWYLMNIWLGDFVYRISIHPWMFVLTMCIAVLVTLFTISFQAIKAAITNPVSSLRAE